MRPHQIDDNNDREEREWIKIYKIYQDACDRAGLVDFSELLLRAYELFLKKPLILQRYRQRFQHILVDEFQDTNNIQYAWIKLLAGAHGKVMIVGDDDQSIYGWRGAKIKNIHRFLQDFSQAQTIRLEQNYRSTGNILQSANQLIANNSNRLGKIFGLPVNKAIQLIFMLHLMSWMRRYLFPVKLTAGLKMAESWMTVRFCIAATVNPAYWKKP